jgi:hypothetical protein
MIVIFKFEPEGHVLKFKHIIRYPEKLMRLKKRNVGFKSRIVPNKEDAETPLVELTTRVDFPESGYYLLTLMPTEKNSLLECDKCRDGTSLLQIKCHKHCAKSVVRILME